MAAPVKNSDRFIIEIKSCEHHTWQGAITWVRTNENQTFRSALEMIQMIDSSVKKE